MWPLEVAVIDVAADRLMQLDAIGEVRNIDQLVLDRPPEAFDQDVVDGPSAAVHTDSNGTALEDLEEVHGSELGSLVGVEDERLAPAKGIVECIAAEGSFQRIGQFPTEDEAAVPVDDGRQIEEAVFHGNVSNIGTPDVIGRLDLDVAQEIGMDLVFGIAHGEARLRIEGFESENAPQTLDALAIDFLADHIGKHYG